jgi:hypothetical protein
MYQFCDGSLYSIHDFILVSTINPQQAMDLTNVALFTLILVSPPNLFNLSKRPLCTRSYIEHMNLGNLHPIVYNCNTQGLSH